LAVRTLGQYHDADSAGKVDFAQTLPGLLATTGLHRSECHRWRAVTGVKPGGDGVGTRADLQRDRGPAPWSMARRRVDYIFLVPGLAFPGDVAAKPPQATLNTPDSA
jgi:hypothetical protein